MQMEKLSQQRQICPSVDFQTKLENPGRGALDLALLFITNWVPFNDTTAEFPSWNHNRCENSVNFGKRWNFENQIQRLAPDRNSQWRNCIPWLPEPAAWKVPAAGSVSASSSSAGRCCWRWRSGWRRSAGRSRRPRCRTRCPAGRSPKRRRWGGGEDELTTKCVKRKMTERKLEESRGTMIRKRRWGKEVEAWRGIRKEELPYLKFVVLIVVQVEELR